MTLIICPGIHDPGLSDRFCQALQTQLQISAAHSLGQSAQACAVLPTQRYAPFDGFAVWTYWQAVADPDQPLLIVAFSAGVVGAVVATQLWQGQGQAIAALIAVDGWGVPQLGEFPFHRVSHDHFTHWSSSIVGAGQDSFYATPPVEHLDLWQIPNRASGLWIPNTESVATSPMRVTAIEFIATLLQRYGCGCRLTFVSMSG